MLDLKQLQYFIASADMHSFSEAARVLYTTQSNVSKAVAGLESRLSVKLFTRRSHGIDLTEDGKRLYEQAAALLYEADQIEQSMSHPRETWLHISMNPNPWFARKFVAFYNEHYDARLHCHIRNASTEEILQRVGSGRDDVGFISAFLSSHDNFQYRLERYQLDFVKISSVKGKLFLGTQAIPGKSSPAGAAGSLTGTRATDMAAPAGSLTGAPQADTAAPAGSPTGTPQADTTAPAGSAKAQPLLPQDLRFVQIYQDEYIKQKSWLVEGTGQQLQDPEVYIITNSDYILHEFLHHSAMANIGGDLFSGHLGAGIPLDTASGEIVYGYVKRRGEDLIPWAREFTAYLGRDFQQ